MKLYALPVFPLAFLRPAGSSFSVSCCRILPFLAPFSSASCTASACQAPGLVLTFAHSVSMLTSPVISPFLVVSSNIHLQTVHRFFYLLCSTLQTTVSNGTRHMTTCLSNRNLKLSTSERELQAFPPQPVPEPAFCTVFPIQETVTPSSHLLRPKT